MKKIINHFLFFVLFLEIPKTFNEISLLNQIYYWKDHSAEYRVMYVLFIEITLKKIKTIEFNIESVVTSS